MNSSTNVSIGEPACSPYTCHIVSSTGSLAESRDLFPQPVRANTMITAMRMANPCFFTVMSSVYKHLSVKTLFSGDF